MRLLRFFVVAVLSSAFIFVAIGAWQTADRLGDLLTVGNKTAQGDGWPAPETPFDIGFVGDPQAALGAPFEDISIQTELGAAPAWLIAPDDGAPASKIWAIVVHGIGGRRENGYRFVPAFREAGMPTMLITYRNDAGAPLSKERLYAFGLTEWPDLEAAVEHALAAGAGSVVLLGESMGGGIVGQFMRHSQRRDRVAALLFDAPALDFPAILDDQMRRAGAPLPALLGPAGMRLFGWRSGIDMADARATDAVASFPGPVFISHGAPDRLVTVAVSDALVAGRKGPTEYLRTEADHILSFRLDPTAYRAAMDAFLRPVAAAD